MQTVRDRQALWAALAEFRRNNQRIALVPTMGNLHEGHLSLVHEARKHAERVVATIFVNPTQFGEGEDFERYPRTLEHDQAGLVSAGCDLCFAPPADQLYPFGLENAVRVAAAPDLAARLEGRFRPGHFDGVVTVVARLFALVQPDVAVFGEKDYQQLLMLRRMTLDLGFNTEIIGAPTVRGDAGLALSSRNAYLAGAELEAANSINRVLAEAAADAVDGDTPHALLEQRAESALRDLGLKPQYVAIRRAQDLDLPTESDLELRILAAAYSGSTRLIDNMPIRRKARS